MKELLQAELARRETPPLTAREINRRLQTIGYKLDRRLDCRHLASYLTGPAAGASYPCITTGIKHIESGLSFAHIDAPRGENFKTLQAWRLSGELYAVVKGSILAI